MSYVCPVCGSDNISRVPLLYKKGHSTGTIVQTEVVGHETQYEKTEHRDQWGNVVKTEKKAVGSTPIYGEVERPSEHLTDLAKEVAPPVPPTPLKKDPGSIETFFSLVLLCALGIVLYSLYTASFSLSEDWKYLVVVVASAYCARIGNREKKKNNLEIAEQNAAAEKQYELDYAAWEKEWLCMRCGSRFSLEEEHP